MQDEGKDGRFAPGTDRLRRHDGATRIDTRTGEPGLSPGPAESPGHSRPPDVRTFICYRREDTGPHAGRLWSDLRNHFGEESVFRDIDSIEPGRRWEKAIDEAIGSCDAVIAVIGTQWLTVEQARRWRFIQRRRRRLDDPNDRLRRELETALERDVRTFPVLVDAAGMPERERLPGALVGLASLQAFVITEDAWDYRVAELIKKITRAAELNRKHAAEMRAKQEAAEEAKREPATLQATEADERKRAEVEKSQIAKIA